MSDEIPTTDNGRPTTARSASSAAYTTENPVVSGQNKAKAQSFLRLVATGQVEQAYASCIAPTFRHHNAYFADDRESLKAGMIAAAATRPDKSIEIKRVIGEGDFVITHSHVRQFPGDRGGAVVHIFRFEAGWIVELWDVGQALPETSINALGMF